MAVREIFLDHERVRGIDRVTGTLGAVALDRVNLECANQLIDAIEPELIERDEAWTEAEKLIDETLMDEELQGLTEEVVALHFAGAVTDTVDRKTRRKARNVASKVYPALINSYVLYGRVKEMGVNEVEHEGLVRSGVGGVKTGKRVSKILGKRAGILTNLENSEEKDLLRDKLHKLENVASPMYGEIFKSENKIRKQTIRHLKKHGASRFIQEFFERSDSEAVSDQLFVDFFIQDLTDKEDESVLAFAVERLGEEAEDGGLASAYIEEVGAKSEGLFDYLQQYFIEKNTGIDFVSSLAKNFGSWPEGLRTGYNQFLDSYGSEVQRQMEILRNKHSKVVDRRSLPTIDQYEVMVEDVFTAFHGTFKDKTVILKRPEGTRKIVSPQVSHRSSRSQEDEPVTKRSLYSVHIDNGHAVWSEKPMDPAELVAKMTPTKARRKPRFTQGVTECLELLANNAFIEGVTSLADLPKLGVGEGERSKVYRLNPKHLKGKITNNGANKARIFFVATKDKIGILAIPPNHEEYGRIIRAN